MLRVLRPAVNTWPDRMVWKHELPCIDSRRNHTWKNYTGNFSRDRKYINRTGLHCFNFECWRGVVDGFLSNEEAQILIEGKRGGAPYSAVMKAREIWKDLPRRMIEVMHHFGASGHIVANSRGKWEKRVPKVPKPEYNWSTLHSDLLSHTSRQL